ncbi:radical SAM/SPASM domain-containing protein [Streptomyces griseorubiginosus]|uniref:radical SAM/SPASM domain-containing protein n=1 Tax=Streptomyces griseorubiginosus TaxID=67304 RepID=UPI0033D3BEA9
MSSTTAGRAVERFDFLARDEGEEWLLFDCVKHSVEPVLESAVTALETSGSRVRRIQRPALAGALSAPLKLFVSVSNRCNLTCTHCMSDSSPAGRIEPTTEELLTLIREAGEMGVFLIVVGGGEPLMRHDIWTLVGAMREQGMGVSLTTNGTIVRTRDLRAFKRHDVRVNVSIDGAEGNHDRIRGREGSFQRTIQGIRTMVDAGITPTVRFTLMNSNLCDVDAVLDLCNELGVPVKARRAKPSGRVIGTTDIITEGTPAYFDAVVKLNKADHCGVEDLMNVEAGAKEPLLLSENDCGAGTRVMFVDEDGTVSPCIFLGSDFRAGQWTPGSLSNFWASAPEFHQMRNLPENKTCGSCSRHSTCHAECPAIRLHVNGSLDGDDPGCIKPLLVQLGPTRLKG